jgi:hypothetical protein
MMLVRRWLWRAVILLLLALALFVLGRGLGLLPSAGGDGAGGAPQGPPAAGGPQPAAPHGESSPPAVEPAGVDDRSTSLLSLVRSALEAGRPATALATLGELERLQLGAPQREQARALSQLAQSALEVETAALVTDVQRGSILAARQRFAELARDRVGPALAAIDAAARAAGWPVVTGAAKAGVYVPKAAPLARERLVRTFRDGIELQARVVDARPHEVTLKVVEGRAMTFPTFPVTRVEPVDATSDEAVELGFAALAADDVPLARLWLCAAIAAGGGGPRLAELRDLLPKAPADGTVRPDSAARPRRALPAVAAVATLRARSWTSCSSVCSSWPCWSVT